MLEAVVPCVAELLLKSTILSTVTVSWRERLCARWLPCVLIVTVKSRLTSMAVHEDLDLHNLSTSQCKLPFVYHRFLGRRRAVVGSVVVEFVACLVAKRPVRARTIAALVRPAVVKSSPYQRRDTLLLSLGFSDYSSYLSSPLWVLIRERVHVWRGRFCVLCRRVAHEVHHLSYSKSVLLGKTLKPLVPLCKRCHRKVEFDSDGSKRTFAQAGRTYRRLLGGRQVDRPWIYVTPRLLRAGTVDGTYTPVQLRLLGLQPYPGWERDLRCRRLTSEEAHRFLIATALPKKFV
jgi:hypothetical protein